MDNLSAHNGQSLGPREDEIRYFLSGFSSGIQICTISPDGTPDGRYFGSDFEAATTFSVSENLSGRNVYFSANEPRADCGSKAKKEQIDRIRAAFVDVDPPKDGSPFDKNAAVSMLRTANPTALVDDTGNGVQALWVLAEPMEANTEAVAEFEAVTQAIVERFGGDKGTWNVDRVLRVPGTINYPNAKKRAAGRVPVMARFIEADASAQRFAEGHRGRPSQPWGYPCRVRQRDV